MASFGFRFSDNYQYRLAEALNNYINWINYASSVLITVHNSVSIFNQQMNNLLEDESYLKFNFSIPSSFEEIQESLKYFLGPTYFSKENTLIHQNNKEKEVTWGQLTEVCEKENEIIPAPASEEIKKLFNQVKDNFEQITQINQCIIEHITSKSYLQDYKQKLEIAYDLIKEMEIKFDIYDELKNELDLKIWEIHFNHYQDSINYPTNYIYKSMEECITLAQSIIYSFRFGESIKNVEKYIASLNEKIAEFNTNKDEILKEIQKLDIQHWEKDVPKDYLSSRYAMFMYQLKVIISDYESFHKNENHINLDSYFSKAYYFYNRKFFYVYKNDLISYYNSSLFVSNHYFLKKTFEPMWFKMIPPNQSNQG